MHMRLYAHNAHHVSSFQSPLRILYYLWLYPGFGSQPLRTLQSDWTAGTNLLPFPHNCLDGIYNYCLQENSDVMLNQQ